MRRLALLFSFSKVVSVFFIWRSGQRITVERVAIPADARTVGLIGLRIALLTDFHGRGLDPSSPIFDEILSFAPDIVCLGGDYVSYHPSQAEPLRPMLQRLSSMAPAYAVSGNHDHLAGWPDIASFLRDCGVHVLSNERTLLDYKGAPLWLVGVDDPASGRDRLGEAMPEGGDKPIICLAHSPSWFVHGKNPLPESVALVLVGHTHGGQIKLPLIGAVTNATGMIFPRRLVEGLSREAHSWLYINRGLGYTKIPVRFLSPAEVTLITIQKTDGVSNDN